MITTKEELRDVIGKGLTALNFAQRALQSDIIAGLVVYLLSKFEHNPNPSLVELEAEVTKFFLQQASEKST